MRKSTEVKLDTDIGRGSVDSGNASTPRGSRIGLQNSRSDASLRRDAAFEQSEVSSMPGAFPEDFERKTTPSSSYRRTVSTGSQPASTLTQNTQNTQHTASTLDSDATSVAPDRKAPSRHQHRVVPVYEHSPVAFPDLQPRPPTRDFVEVIPQPTMTPIFDVGGPSLDSPSSFGMTPMGAVSYTHLTLPTIYSV